MNKDNRIGSEKPGTGQGIFMLCRPKWFMLHNSLLFPHVNKLNVDNVEMGQNRWEKGS
jgi:hypothetical protein